MKILFFGDIVGSPGRRAFKENITSIKAEHDADFVIVNGENVAGGNGISGRIAIDLMRSGAQVITTGDHVWDQPDLRDFIQTEPRLLRPLNYPIGTPGAGSVVLQTDFGAVAVICLRGNTFIQPPLANPFTAIDDELEKLHSQNPELKIIFVDLHAEATSEKIAMGYHLDGRVSAVIGTHTHVPTADGKILANGTAYQSDVGMCGVEYSILGREVAPIMRRFANMMPVRMPVATQGKIILCAVLIEISTTGRAQKITPLQYLVD